MLKTFAVALLAIVLPVGLAQAHGMGHHMHAPWASPRRRPAPAVRRLNTVRCCAIKDNGATLASVHDVNARPAQQAEKSRRILP
jgi:hypothetical protein